MSFANRTQSRLAFTLLFAVAVAQSCTVWRKEPVVAERFTERKHPSAAKLTMGSGAIVTLLDPVIRGDSLVATRLPELTPAQRRRSPPIMAVPLADIRSMQVRRVSGSGTAFLIIGVGVTIAAIGGALDAPPAPARPRPTTPTAISTSCPYVYVWDGKEWRLESGTFGGAILKALTRTDVDNIDHVATRDNVLRLKLANELAETDHVDALSVLAVDHDPDIYVAPDASGRIHTLGAYNTPISARDFKGRDVLEEVRAVDGWNWESQLTIRDTAQLSEIRDGVELTFVRPAGARSARLIVDGNNTPWAGFMMVQFIEAFGSGAKAWIEALEAQPERARTLSRALASEGFLGVSLWTGQRWTQKGLVWEAGPEVRKRQVMSLDLTGVEGDTVRVRLESIPSFWLLDGVALDYMDERAISVTELHAESAVDFRGRDVREQLRAAEQSEYIMEPGQHAELRFRVPPTPPGKTRSYLLRTTGWYQIHTSDAGEPNAALARIGSEQYLISRLAVDRMNSALTSMGARRR